MFRKFVVITGAFLVLLVVGSIRGQYVEHIRYPGDTEPYVQQIKGAKVSTQEEAKKIAKEAYSKKTKYKVSVAGARTNVEVLGFDVPGFGKMGDKVWDVRFTKDITNVSINATIAIIWVHPKTAEVYFLIGPWVADEKKE